MSQEKEQEVEKQAGPQSLRERKKLNTEHLLWHKAIELFTARGFDHVSVATIADEVGVSKMTVFNYFPTKEDLVVRPMEEHSHDMARAVRERTVGESAVMAVRRQFLRALELREPMTGLSDDPFVLQVRRLVMSTPSLMQRTLGIYSRSEAALASELESQVPDSPLTARIAAAQILQVRRVLAQENVMRLSNGENIEAVYPDALAHAGEAFDLLESGLGDYCTRVD